MIGVDVVLTPYDLEHFNWFLPLSYKFGLHIHHNLRNCYTPIVEKFNTPEKKQFLGSKEQCRYCKAYNKNVDSIKKKITNGELELKETDSFKQIAHSLPTFIGNTSIISKDECDTCNKKFSRLETSLVSFLGTARTTSKMKGRNGIPKSKNNKGEFIDISSKGDLIVGTYQDTDMYKEENNIITITTKKKYVPIDVHKCFVKMALSVIPLEKLQYFTKTIDWILGKIEIDDVYSDHLYVWQTKWPVRNMFPSVFIDVYQRRFDRIDIPFMFSRICFRNYAFQFVIPYSPMDFLIKEYNIPPIIGHEYEYQELLTDRVLWHKILNDVNLTKINLSNHSEVEEEDKQYYMTAEQSSPATSEDLPKEIIEYLERNKIDFR
ncbi:hypothetical protein [Aeromonas hydrophila]|uniref:hypothetical protein n=1 Tax=Aeromonas hydrophila TaxID=644 RepID=UPI002B45CDBF|nr:hypothetical protein [Aeromonas hydrophila]